MRRYRNVRRPSGHSWLSLRVAQKKIIRPNNKHLNQTPITNPAIRKFLIHPSFFGRRKKNKNLDGISACLFFLIWIKQGEGPGRNSRFIFVVMAARINPKVLRHVFARLEILN
jgi:hypothetical protein